MKRELTIYKTGNLKRVGWNHQYIEVPQIKCFIGLHVKCQYGNGMVSAFLSIFIDMASLDALWETFDKGCIKIKEAHIGEVIKNRWDDTCKVIDYKNNTNVTEECNSHFYFTEYHLFHFINAIRDFYGHV